MHNAPRRRLDDVVTLVTDKVLGRKDPGLPYVGLEHIPSAGSRVLGVGYSTDSVSTNVVFRCGDTLFGKLRPRLRKAVQVEFDGYCSTDILVLRSQPAINPVFASFTLRSDTVFAHAVRTEEGTRMPRCSWAEIKSVEVFCPDLPEQSAVADVLMTLDDAIEETEALIAKTERVKAGLIYDLFTRGVTPDGGMRPVASDAPHLYKESQLGRIPREWSVATLSERRRPDRAHLKTGPFGSSLKTEHWVRAGRPVITIGALGEGELIESELLYVSEQTAKRLRDYALQCGDVVFSRVADVGRSAVINREQRGWLMSSNLMRISLDPEAVRPAFLQAQLSHDDRVRRQIRAKVNAGGRDVANSDILNRLLFAWPPRQEQDQIMTRVSALADMILQERKKRDHLKCLRQGLMHDLLAGSVRVIV